VSDVQTEAVVVGRVRHERHDRILKIIIDNPTKKNAFHPQMMAELAEAMTLLETDDELWTGVLCAEGENFTAGLDMPKFFGPGAAAHQRPRPAGAVDPFGLGRRLTKPLVTAVSGICFTVGIEMALAGDIVIAADDARFCQMEAKRGIAPLGGAHFRYITRAGWGNASTTSCCAMNSVRRRPIASASCRRWSRWAGMWSARWRSRGSSTPTRRWGCG